MIHAFPTNDEFAHAVAADGPEAYELELTRLAHHARHTGVSRGVLEALLDRSMPEVLRQRAFGTVMRSIAQPAAV